MPPFIFGCEDCTDSLDHYVVCDPLWSIVISCASSQSEHLRCGPLSKLGFGASPMSWWRMLSIAFFCYHAIKLEHRDEVLSVTASGHPCQVLNRLIGTLKCFQKNYGVFNPFGCHLAPMGEICIYESFHEPTYLKDKKHGSRSH